MKNEFPISNLRAKYADKTADGKDISEAIAEAQLAGDIPVLSSETAEEIYKTKPKFIKYSARVWVLQEIATPDVFYSSVYNETMAGIDIQDENGTYSFTMTEFYPANTSYVDASQRAGTITELTNDTAAQIYNTKPKFIKYDGSYYVLSEFSDPDVYYASVGLNISVYIDITYDASTDEVTFTSESAVLATQNYVDTAVGAIQTGTKLYRHHLSFTDIDVDLITTTVEPETGFIGGPPNSQVLNYTDVVSFYSNYGFIGMHNRNGKILFNAYKVNIYTIDGTTFYGLMSTTLGSAPHSFISDTVTPL